MSVPPNPSQLEAMRLIALHPGENYVYLLRRPDDIECWGGRGTPFYVGIGNTPGRLFQHVRDAGKTRLDRKGQEKLKTKNGIIREMLAAGLEVVYTIDSFWGDMRWDGAHLRECELIRAIGLLRDGTGSLANGQIYELGPDDMPLAYRTLARNLPKATTPAGWVGP